MPRSTLDKARSQYHDAYAVAGSMVKFGGLLKAVGIVGACGIALLALLNGGAASPTIQIGGAVVVSGLWWAFFYSGGMMVSAQGQLLNAALDTAVNTAR